MGFEILKSSFCSEVSLQPCTRIHAVSEENEYMEQLAFTWEFTPISERSCRLDLGLDFTLRSAEHVLLWELSQEQIDPALWEQSSEVQPRPPPCTLPLRPGTCAPYPALGAAPSLCATRDLSCSPAPSGLT